MPLLSEKMFVIRSGVLSTSTPSLRTLAHLQTLFSWSTFHTAVLAL